MALSAKVGSFTVAPSTGSKAVTGLGFQPKIVLFWGDANTADTDSGSTLRWFIGAATSSSSRFAIAMNNESSEGTEHANDQCIWLLTSGNGNTHKADFTSMDADGFTVNFSVVTSGVVVNFLALGGADLTNVAIKQIQSPAATGAQATTGVGFKPDAILTFTTADITAPDHLNVSRSTIGIGAGTGPTARWATTNDWDGVNPEQYQRTNAVLAAITNNTKVLEADLTSLDSDGFTLNYSTVTTNAYIWVVCLKGGRFKAGSFTQPTATGNKAVTGVGFQPVTELFASATNVAGTTIAATTAGATTIGEALMLGAMSGASARGVTSYAWQDSSSPKQVLNRATAIRMLGAAGAMTVAADFVSHDADGFTINFSSADAVAREILYLAFGSAASTATPPRPTIVNQAVQRAATR